MFQIKDLRLYVAPIYDQRESVWFQQPFGFVNLPWTVILSSSAKQASNQTVVLSGTKSTFPFAEPVSYFSSRRYAVEGMFVNKQNNHQRKESYWASSCQSLDRCFLRKWSSEVKFSSMVSLAERPFCNCIPSSKSSQTVGAHYPCWSGHEALRLISIDWFVRSARHPNEGMV